MKLQILSDIHSVYSTLQQTYFTNYKTTIININHKIKYDNLTIIEPFRIDNKYSTISPIWKNYLGINSPNTKLIVMGFMDFQSRNYIDLFKLPKDFDKYLENALSVSEDWEIPIDGADILEYIKRFFAGHGGNSVLSKLNSLRQTFNIAHTGLADGSLSLNEIKNELLFPYGKAEWEELLNRWKNYYPYFEYLPFKPAMGKINKTFADIKEFFSYNNITKQIFYEKQINERLDEVYEDLHNIDKLYIRPEIYEKSFTQRTQ